MKYLTHFLALSIIFLASAAQAQDGTYYVRVRSTKLRSAMQHFAPSVGDLKLGDAVTGVPASDGWYKVKTVSKKSGYIHQSVLTDKKIITANTKYNPTTDSSDVVLAGKGFNKEVEKQYASMNKNLNFVEVNLMDQITVKDSDLISFVKAGGLRSNG